MALKRGEMALQRYPRVCLARCPKGVLDTVPKHHLGEDLAATVVSLVGLSRRDGSGWMANLGMVV